MKQKYSDIKMERSGNYEKLCNRTQQSCTEPNSINKMAINLTCVQEPRAQSTGGEGKLS
jgi:hypothetical protein